MTEKIVIPQNWTFADRHIAEAFEYHVRESLPWYDLVSGAVAHIARHFIPQNGRVYDIGASTGNIGRALEQTIVSRNVEFIAIENAEQMALQYKAPGVLKITDAIGFEFEPFDVAIIMLTMMFMSTNDRRQWLKALCGKMKVGGAIIIVDKIEPPLGYLATVLHRLTIAGKKANNVAAEDIIAKELALGGVQRPLPYNFISMVAPNCAEWFRFGEFAGYIITAPE